MTNRTLIIILAIILIVAIGAGGYWLWSQNRVAQGVISGNTTPTTPQFVPLNRPSQSTSTRTGTNNLATTTIATTTATATPIPVLRLLSDTPVGGYTASTTASTTIIRWVDRGRGNIYEAREDTLDIKTLSNTLLPRVYTSVWNKDATAFVGMMLADNNSAPSALYASLMTRPIAPVASTTASSSILSLAPYDLKGKKLPDNTTAMAVSPSGKQVFLLVKEGTGSSGYIANFDGSKMARIFQTPLRELNVEWPTDNIIAITTKGSASLGGFLYFVNPKTGVWSKVLGPYAGLSTRISHDGKYAIVSVTGKNDSVITNIYTIAKNTGVDAVVATLADKCTWGNFYKDLVYCAVPFQPVSGVYPDDWYKGTLSTIDKMWEINASTGEVRLVGQIIGQAGRVIDAYNLGLDKKDDYLFFMNKNDLSLWSLDLVRSN